MKVVSLSENGFNRKKEFDFSDDGNRFLGYEFEGMEISYLRDGKTYYISPHVDSDILTYEEYSEIPGYRDLDFLNGKDDVTVDDLKELRKRIHDYNEKLHEKEANAETPTDEELAEIINSGLKLLRTKLITINKTHALSIENIANIAMKVDLEDVSELVKELRTKIADWESWLARLSDMSRKRKLTISKFTPESFLVYDFDETIEKLRQAIDDEQIKSS